MKAEEHTQWVGAIVTNLQALETVLRYFLAKMRNEAVEFPKVGDKTVKSTYLTRRTSLGKLIRTFNEALTDAEKKFKVDIGVVHIRDAIAHGRLATTKELPFRLWKFGPRKNGNVDIEFSEELTADWLKNTSARWCAKSKRCSIVSRPGVTRGSVSRRGPDVRKSPPRSNCRRHCRSRKS